MRRPARVRGVTRRLALVVPATHAAARVVRRTVTDFARLDGLASDEVDQLALVVSELLGNAVDHGGGEAAMDESDLERDVSMRLELALDAERWTVIVSDQGGGDPAVLAGYLEPEADIPLDDERGRGFFLLREMVDELQVDASSDGLGLRVRAERRHGA
jgi:anti-sigma regulatory factor (Ser/Thr protein kinase)